MPRHKITQSDNPRWRTPSWLRDAVRAEFPIVIDMAADTAPGCPLVTNWVGPGSELLEDALCGVPWAHIAAEVMGTILHPAIWCNPPYAKGNAKEGKPDFPITPWIKAGAEAGQRVTTVMLLPHAHQTLWWADYVESPDPLLRAAEVRPFPFRLAFDPPPDYTGVPTGSNVNHALVIWSPHTRHFREPWAPARFPYDPRTPALSGRRRSHQTRSPRGGAVAD